METKHKLPLTSKQKELLDFLSDFIKTNEVSPTQPQIARANGTSTANVNRYLRELAEKGWIRKSNKRQSIEIV